MMIKKSILLVLSLSIVSTFVSAKNGFEVVALGARGGIEDGNLSAYLIRPQGDHRAVTCDAGSLIQGIKSADEKGAFSSIRIPIDSEYNRVGYVLNDMIKGYFISHAHLDHIAGLIIASPDDTKKSIYGSQSTLDDIGSTYFNWVAWPNFSTVGIKPRLGKYTYQNLIANQAMAVKNTAMMVTAFPLAHGFTTSSAFLFEANGDAILCFGDTGPDSVQKSHYMKDIWQAVAPKVKSGALKAIIIESSYDNTQPDKLLFGHMTPKYINESLAQLAGFVGDSEKLKDLPVVISHVKFTLKKGEEPQVKILRELNAGNKQGVKFIMPEQGDFWTFE